MIRIFLTVVSLFIILPSFAMEKIEYKNLKEGSKIVFNNDIWDTKVNKKTNDYFIKRVSEGISKFSEFYSPSGVFLFSTATEYEFINKGRLIGYSNADLKFYEFNLQNGLLSQRELLSDEVQDLFPKYEIIKISDFSTTTNSLKIKKKRGESKIILLNDTDKYFNNYAFTTNNSKFDKYLLRGFLDINQKGMIQFSRFGDNTKFSPWYILLIR